MNSLTFFGPLKNVIWPFFAGAEAALLDAPPFAAGFDGGFGGVAFFWEMVALVIGVSHVDNLAHGSKVGFSFLQQAQTAAT